MRPGPDRLREVGRNLPIVCTTAQPVLIMVTVYQPQRPKWVTPTERAPHA